MHACSYLNSLKTRIAKYTFFRFSCIPVKVDFFIRTGCHTHAPASALLLVDQDNAVLGAFVDGVARTRGERQSQSLARAIADLDAALQLEATRASQEAAQAYLDDTRNRFRENAKLLQDVLEAEFRFSNARRDFTDALAGYWSATAELERTIGHEH